MRIRTYSELSTWTTFLGRYEYLKLGSAVGATSFGFDRYINQAFYKSREWKSVRQEIIIRDNGCDLGIDEFEIHGELLVHHINPLSITDLVDQENWVINPEYLITTTKATHNAIHYGDASMLPKPPVVRQRNDTKLW